MFRLPFILSTTANTWFEIIYLQQIFARDDLEYLFVIFALSCFSDFDRSGQTRGDLKDAAFLFVLHGAVPITVDNSRQQLINSADNFLLTLYSSGISCRKGSVNAFHKQQL